MLYVYLLIYSLVFYKQRLKYYHATICVASVGRVCVCVFWTGLGGAQLGYLPLVRLEDDFSFSWCFWRSFWYNM